MAGKTDGNSDLHEGHPEAGYRAEDISKEMKKHVQEVDALIVLLKSPYQLDREKAADYLGDIGDRKALVPLVEALRDPVISWIAAESLGKIGDAGAVKPLIAVLGSEEKWLRRNAATALGLIGDREAVAPLIKLLSDPKHDVRQAAAAALGQLGGDEPVNALRLLANDPDEKVRRTAAAALEQIEKKKNVTTPGNPADQLKS